MGWVRSHCGKAAWLAFLALACQYILTFDHVHFGGVKIASAVAAVAADKAPGPTETPPAPKTPTSLDDDFCAICKNISLAGTLVLPASPALVTPMSFVRRAPWSATASEPPARNHFHFDARGPPDA
jgi:hypothetical protein